MYSPETVRIVNNLKFDWSGWILEHFPETLPLALESCSELWENEGFTLCKWKVAGNKCHCLFNVSPTVVPTFLTQRVKGRLQHALRKLGTPVKFKRNFGFRSLGDNDCEIVRGYINRQVAKSDYLDPRFKDWLDQFHYTANQKFLKDPFVNAHGFYWYHLHVVIVIKDRRFPMTRDETFQTVRKICLETAAGNGHCIAALSVMPDHIHMALRGNVAMSPQDICLNFMNSLSVALGDIRCWDEKCYAGTFGSYRVSLLPPGQARW